MTRHHSTLALLTVLILASAGAPAKPPVFDSKLAIDLATAYLRFDSRYQQNATVGAIDFAHPVLTTAMDSRHRKFVFVSFSAGNLKAGAYATFQVCKWHPALIPAEIGTADDIAAYRTDTGKVGPTVYLAVESVCPGHAR